MTTLAWERRPLEERVNHNPAFLAILLRAAASGYAAEADRALPIPLAWVVLPLALHRPTREALPTTIATSMPIWLQEHQVLREGFPPRMRSLAAAGREAIIVGLATGLLRLDGSALTPAAEPGRARRATSDSQAVVDRTRFVGRWLARAGDVETIYFLWGVKP